MHLMFVPLCFKLTNRKHLRFHNWPFTYRVYVFFDKMYLFHTELICGFHKPLINYKRDKLLWLWNQLCNVHADDYVPWWRHQMETFSALLVLCAGNSPVTGEFPAQRPVTRSFDVFFDLRQNKRLSKQCWGWWFERAVRPLWRHCNGLTGRIWIKNHSKMSFW